MLKKQHNRLGHNGFAEIRTHPFFEGFDFDALIKKELSSPFKPTLNGTLDVGNFDEEFTSKEVVTSVIPEKNLEFIKRNQEQFNEFNK